MNQHGPVRKKLKVSNGAASSPSYPFNSESTIQNHHTIPSPTDSTPSNPIAYPPRQPQIPENPIQLTPTDYFKLQSTLTELSDFLSAKHSESLTNEVNSQNCTPESHSLLQSHSDSAHLRKVNEKLRKQNEQYKKQIEELKKSNEEMKFQKEVLDARVLVLERIQASRLFGVDFGSGTANATSSTASGHAGPTDTNTSSIWGSLQSLAPGAINVSDTVIQNVIQTIMKSQLNHKPSHSASASTDPLVSISAIPKYSESRSSHKSLSATPDVENQQESQTSQEYPASEPPASSSSASLPLPQSVQLWQAVTKASQLQSSIKNLHPTAIPIPPLSNSAMSIPTPPVPVPVALHSKSTSSSSSSSSSSSHQNGLSQSQSISNMNSTPDLSSSSTNHPSHSRSRTAHLPNQSSESDSEGSIHNSQQSSQDPEYDYEKLSGFVSQVRSLLAMQPYRTV